MRERGRGVLPRGELADALRVEGDKYNPLDQPITKEDDNRVLKMKFEQLDGLAVAAKTAPPQMDVGPYRACLTLVIVSS